MALDSRPTSIDENKAQGSREDYRNSDTVQSITELLVDRYRAGGQKYGVFVDQAVVPTEMTGETSWAEMALNETLDGVTYALKARDEVNDLRAEVTRLDGLVKDFSGVANSLVEQNQELVTQLDAANAQIELLSGERQELHKRGDMTTEEESALVHANLELSIENETLKEELTRVKAAGNRLYTEYKLIKNKHDNLVESSLKVPRFVRGLYNA